MKKENQDTQKKTHTNQHVLLRNQAMLHVVQWDGKKMNYKATFRDLKGHNKS